MMGKQMARLKGLHWEKHLAQQMDWQMVQ